MVGGGGGVWSGPLPPSNPRMNILYRSKFVLTILRMCDCVTEFQTVLMAIFVFTVNGAK